MEPRTAHNDTVGFNGDMTHPRAGTPALPEDLVDVPHLVTAYYTVDPDPERHSQRVVFGTSGHRGTSLDGSFNESHIAATTQAIVEHRRRAGIEGPIFLGKDPHAASEPAWTTALEVLAANGLTIMIEEGYTPTPALSHAILRHNHLRSIDDPQRADGIVVTPSHNPPSDGGFKYNPPHGGPADSSATSWIAERANRLMAEPSAIRRVRPSKAMAATISHPFLDDYVADLPSVVDLDRIRESGVRVGADPMGGAAVDYWARIAEVHGLDLTVVNPHVDPTWRFMTLDWDGKIRMDCSSRYAMASLVADKDRFDVSTGNDADADRHGIVTPDAGLMNPNHFLAVAIDHLFRTRSWTPSAAVGKTLVSSTMIDRVAAALGRDLIEVPVGFKWFVDGLARGSLGFAGEESAGASFLRRDGSVWTTDKDGIVMCLLAAEIIATTGHSPSARYRELTADHGEFFYDRIDAPATGEEKTRLAALSADRITATDLAGDPITAVLVDAPGNGAAIGGLKVTTDHGWFAARPSGTEDVYKIYAESSRDSAHLARIQDAARDLVSAALGA